MGNDLGNLEPPKLFGRRPAKRPEAVAEPSRSPAPGPRRPPITVNPYAASAAVGLVVGVALAGLTWAALQIGNAGRGSFFLVLVIFVAAVVIGAGLLRLGRFRSPGTIAFLATGVVAVVAMLTGTDALESWGGAIGVIVASAVAYPAVRWLTVTYIDRL